MPNNKYGWIKYAIRGAIWPAASTNLPPNLSDVVRPLLSRNRRTRSGSLRLILYALVDGLLDGAPLSEGPAMLANPSEEMKERLRKWDDRLARGAAYSKQNWHTATQPEEEQGVSDGE